MPLTGYLHLPEIEGESRRTEEKTDDFEFDFSRSISKEMEIDEYIDIEMSTEDYLSSKYEEEKRESYYSKEDIIETEEAMPEYFDFI